jgi:hypothetical protein
MKFKAGELLIHCYGKQMKTLCFITYVEQDSGLILVSFWNTSLERYSEIEYDIDMMERYVSQRVWQYHRLVGETTQ